jgi:mannosyltransferase OCH1-like enzyme
MIPKVIYITYKDNNIPDYIIPNWKNMNPDYQVKFFTDEDCEKFLKENFPENYLEFFKYVKHGPIKADFFRTCILKLHGGVYADADIQPLVPINQFLDLTADFLTVLSKPSNGLVNPHFIACTPNHPITNLILEGFLKLKSSNVPYSYHGYSIVPITGKIIYKVFGGKGGSVPMKGPWTICSDYFHIPQGTYKKPKGIIQLLQETCPTRDHYDCGTFFKDKKVMNNRYRDYKNHSF